MPVERITKRTVEAALPQAARYIIFDTTIPGFGLRVFPSGQKSWVFEYRAGEGGRGAQKKRLTLGKVGDFTPDQARKEADRLRTAVKTGGDPQAAKTERRAAPTVADVADSFLQKHVDAKRKASTAWFYRDMLERVVLPELGKVKAKDLKRTAVSHLHVSMQDRPYQGNRMLAVVGSMFTWAAGEGLVPEGHNPARGIEKYPEEARGQQLDAEQLELLGAAIREAETIGIPWDLNPEARAKHRAKGEKVTRISEHAAAAIRLLLFTGARLREILHLKWEQVDLARGMLLLTDHKTSRKTGAKAIVLNPPALAVLKDLTRVGAYVIAGETAGTDEEKPRADLKKPWALVTKRAGLEGVRIHDLRHNFASFGAGGGMGLPVIGKLLGHTQPQTTARYAHLDNDPLRKASNTIASAIAAAMGEAPPAPDNVVPITVGKR